MKDLLKMMFVLTTICLVAAFALSQVYAVTKGPIAKAKRMEKLAAIKAVLPAYDNEPDREEKAMGGRVCYPGTQGGQVVGFAFEATSPNGYSGDIKVMVGVTPQGEISGLQILDHKETPGLGSKIEDAQWRDTAIWTDAQKSKRRTLSNSRWNVKKDGGDIDQISGATISPRAVVEAMRGGLKDFDKAKNELGLAKGNGETLFDGKQDEPSAEKPALEMTGVAP